MSDDPVLPARPLTVFRSVVIGRTTPVGDSTTVRVSTENATRVVSYAFIDGPRVAMRRARVRRQGIGQFGDVVRVEFEARERIDDEGWILSGTWSGTAIGQVVKNGRHTDLVTWHYLLDVDRSEGRSPTAVRLPTDTASPRLGLIGAGAFAWNVIVPSLRRAGAPPIVVADASAARAAALARSEHIPVVADAPASLFEPRLGLDGVVIACAHGAHARYARQALLTGCHVLVEKPAALDVEELDRLIAAVRSSGRGLWVGHNRRHARGFVDLRAAVARRSHGSYLQASVEAYPLSPFHWYRAPGQGGRVLGNLTHWLDLAIAAYGDSMPVEMRAAPLAGDGVAADLRFPGAGLAEIRLIDVGSRLIGGRETIAVRTSDASIRIGDWRRVECETRSRHTVRRGVRDRGHDRSYRTWVDAVRSGRARDEQALQQLTRAHATAFTVSSALAAGRSEWTLAGDELVTALLGPSE